MPCTTIIAKVVHGIYNIYSAVPNQFHGIVTTFGHNSMQEYHVDVGSIPPSIANMHSPDSPRFICPIVYQKILAALFIYYELLLIIYQDYITILKLVRPSCEFESYSNTQLCTWPASVQVKCYYIDSLVHVIIHLN